MITIGWKTNGSDGFAESNGFTKFQQSYVVIVRFGVEVSVTYHCSYRSHHSFSIGRYELIVVTQNYTNLRSFQSGKSDKFCKNDVADY